MNLLIKISKSKENSMKSKKRKSMFVASVVALIISFLWYGPVFGKTWMNIKKTPKQAAQR